MAVSNEEYCGEAMVKERTKTITVNGVTPKIYTNFFSQRSVKKGGKGLWVRVSTVFGQL